MKSIDNNIRVSVKFNTIYFYKVILHIFEKMRHLFQIVFALKQGALQLKPCHRSCSKENRIFSKKYKFVDY